MTTKTAVPQNVNELRNDLTQLYGDFTNKKVSAEDAKTKTMIAGKILSTTKVEMEYGQLTGKARKIKFLEY